jgi:hypothetical protein
MRRLEITIRKPGQDGERQVVLGRFAAVLVTVLLMVAVIERSFHIIFGYLAIGLLQGCC